jgi:hypothetical protein
MGNTSLLITADNVRPAETNLRFIEYMAECKLSCFVWTKPPKVPLSDREREKKLLINLSTNNNTNDH